MNMLDTRCVICDTLTFPNNAEYLEDDLCDDCARVIALDLTIDLNFRLAELS